MSTEEYRQVLKDGAFLWIDHHDFVRSTFSEENFATNSEEIHDLIENFQSYRDKINWL